MIVGSRFSCARRGCYGAILTIAAGAIAASVIAYPTREVPLHGLRGPVTFRTGGG
jgi:hypothetical protein